MNNYDHIGMPKVEGREKLDLLVKAVAATHPLFGVLDHWDMNFPEADNVAWLKIAHGNADKKFRTLMVYSQDHAVLVLASTPKDRFLLAQHTHAIHDHSRPDVDWLDTLIQAYIPTFKAQGIFDRSVPAVSAALAKTKHTS